MVYQPKEGLPAEGWQVKFLDFTNPHSLCCLARNNLYTMSFRPNDSEWRNLLIISNEFCFFQKEACRDVCLPPKGRCWSPQGQHNNYIEQF